MAEALRVLSQPTSIHFQRLMEDLFARERVYLPARAAEAAAQSSSPLYVEPPPTQLQLSRIHDALGSLFKRHGAICLTLPPLALKRAPLPSADDETPGEFLLDPSGHLLGSYPAGRHPLCTYLSQHAPETIFKRYTLGFSHRRPKVPSSLSLSTSCPTCHTQKNKKKLISLSHMSHFPFFRHRH